MSLERSHTVIKSGSVNSFLHFDNSSPFVGCFLVCLRIRGTIESYYLRKWLKELTSDIVTLKECLTGDTSEFREIVREERTQMALPHDISRLRYE